MSNRSEKVASPSVDDAKAAAETSEMMLARFVASFEQANRAQVDYQALRQLLPGAIAEAAQLIRREHEAGIESQNGLAVANEVALSMKRTVERLTKSMQAEYEAAIALLGNRQGQEGSAPNRSAVNWPKPSQSRETRPPQTSVSARLFAPQIAEALRRMIEKEVDRRMSEARQMPLPDRADTAQNQQPTPPPQ